MPITTHTSIQLRIKLLSLASEARHIRRWERRLLGAARSGKAPGAKDRFWSIRNHRCDDIAPEARATLLAFGFLRGMPYKRMEQRRYSDPDWANICRMAVEYRGDYSGDLTADFKAWREAAGLPDKRFPANAPPAAVPAPAEAKSAAIPHPATSTPSAAWTGSAEAGTADAPPAKRRGLLRKLLG